MTEPDFESISPAEVVAALRAVNARVNAELLAEKETNAHLRGRIRLNTAVAKGVWEQHTKEFEELKKATFLPPKIHDVMNDKLKPIFSIYRAHSGEYCAMIHANQAFANTPEGAIAKLEASLEGTPK